MPNRTPSLLLFLFSSVLLLAPGRSALAEPPPGGYGEPVQQPTAQPAYGQPTAQPAYGQPVQQPAYGQPQQQPVQQQPVTAQQGRGIQYGAHLIVPVWLTDVRSASPSLPGVSADPGIGIQGRLGWEFPGGFSTEFNIGYMINNVTTTDVGGLSESEQLDAFWFGVGARYSLLNRTAWVPFVGVGLQLTGWGDATCSGTCSRSYTLGINGIVGLVLEVSEFLGLEAGVQVMASSKGDAFADPQLIVSPLAGLTLYY
jgi:hypothetical protein